MRHKFTGEDKETQSIYILMFENAVLRHFVHYLNVLFVHAAIIQEKMIVKV